MNSVFYEVTGNHLHFVTSQKRTCVLVRPVGIMCPGRPKNQPVF